MSRTGEIDEAADRRARDRRELPGTRIHRDRAREQRGRHQVRHDRLPRRHRERARDAEHDHHREYRPGDGEPGQREREQRERAQALERDAQCEDARAVAAIGDVACGQHQQHERQELGQANQAEVERLAGDRVDLPADRDRLHLHRDRREQPRRQEAHEARVVEEFPERRARAREDRHVRISARRAGATCAAAARPRPRAAGRRP